MRIKKNDLTHWFIRDHRTLPASYVKSCRKFFDEIRKALDKAQASGFRHELQATSNKQQATSNKRQA
jgi:hypothetical protein